MNSIRTVAVLRTAVAVLAMLSPCPLFAALNPQEVAAVRQIISAAKDMSEAERHLVGAGPAAAWSLQVLINGSQDLTTGFAILIGVNPENEGARDRVAAWDAKPRSEQVNGLYGAWAYLDRAVRAARVAHDELRAVLPGNPAAIRLEEAAYKLEHADRTQPFADPYPVPLMPGATVPTLFGPHGDYRGAQKTLYAGLGYFRRWAAEEVTSAVNGVYNAFGSPFIHYTVAADSWHVAMGMFAGVPETDADATEDQTCRTMRAFWRLSEDIPFRFHFAGGNMFTDAWFHLDRAWFRIMWLYNSNRCVMPEQH